LISQHASVVAKTDYNFILVNWEPGTDIEILSDWLRLMVKTWWRTELQTFLATPWLAITLCIVGQAN